MLRSSQLFLLLLIPLLFSGCATTITNLTPAHQPRNAQGLYPVEFGFNSQPQSLKWETLTPFAIVGEEHFPMHKVELMRNRFEGFILLPPNKNLIHFRFKVDFEYNDFGQSPPDSALSTTYSLQIKNETDQ